MSLSNIFRFISGNPSLLVPKCLDCWMLDVWSCCRVGRILAMLKVLQVFCSNKYQLSPFSMQPLVFSCFFCQKVYRSCEWWNRWAVFQSKCCLVIFNKLLARVTCRIHILHKQWQWVNHRGWITNYGNNPGENPSLCSICSCSTCSPIW